MYIKKYWGSFIGGSDDSLNLQNLDEYNTPRPPYPHHCYAGGVRCHE